MSEERTNKTKKTLRMYFIFIKRIKTRECFGIAVFILLYCKKQNEQNMRAPSILQEDKAAE